MNAPSLRQPLQRLVAAISVYLDRQVLVVTLLGFSAGLPLALTTSTLMLWMTDVGVDLTTVGLYALAGLPYTLKFLWAPLVDAWRIPVLSRLLGRRRGWLIFTQLLLIAAIVVLGGLDPLNAPLLIALAAVFVAAVSATQDIVIDAFRVESLGIDQQAAGVGGYVMAYRLALLVSSAGVVGVVGFLEATGMATETVWFYGYAGAAGLIVLGMAAVVAGREPRLPESADPETATAAPTAARPLVVAVAAFADMFKMPMAAAVLLFVLLFRFTDAFAGIMIGPFVIDMGYDKQAYAAIVKGLGTGAVIAGGLIGGVIAKTLPLTTSLWIAGILQATTNLVFSWIALQGVDHTALALGIVVDNVASGIATVIFIAYLSSLCANPLHTATQFALLTALASTGRTVLSASAGAVADSVGWFWFFGVSALVGVPALILLAWLQSRGHFDPVELKVELDFDSAIQGEPEPAAVRPAGAP
jgi:MFS transporter, PAT family, beta-lactamase induction signal transducer AmpG